MVLPTFPTVSVEVAFASDPSAETPTWTDVTADLRYSDGVSTNRGRQRELDQYQAGTCTYVLNNRTRAYDDEINTDAKPMKRTRIRATYDGVVYPVFDGYVDQFALEYENPREARAVVQATDAFKPLAAAELATSVYAQLVAEAAPVAWWRLDESDNSAVPLVVHDSVGDIGLTARNGAAVGSETLVSRDPGASASFSDAVTYDDGFVGDGIRLPLQGGPLTIEAVARATSISDGGITGNVTHVQGTGATLQFDGLWGFTVATSPGVAAYTGVSGASLVDGLTHHMVGVWGADGSLKMYVDGVDRTVGTPTLAIGTFSQTTGYVFIGAFDQDSLAGNIDEVAFYDRALTVAEIQAHHDAMYAPWDGDSPVERIERILDAEGWPVTLRSHDAAGGGSSTLQPATLNMSALDHLRRVAASEFGDVFITRAGEVRLVGRASLVNRPELFTFTDDDPTGSPSYVAIGWDASDQLIRNDVTVSRNDGIAQRATNEASIATYLRHSYTADGLIHDDDELSRDAAEFIVAEYSEHKRRITQMTVAATRNPTILFPAVLGVELGDEVTVVFHPPGGGTFTQDSRIEGISHQFNSRHWETTFALSPAYADDFLELDAGPENAGLDFARLAF
ncbi:MAG: LamG domain-containing protein [Chloroflexi bacterium]|nr:LamG domain-containing protein [Chloroflexota bacterium]